MSTERWLLLVFLFSLILLNAWVCSDGVGYYAYARAPRSSTASISSLNMSVRTKASARREHGLFSWTRLLLLATVGLVLFRWRESRVGTPPLAAALAFYVFIACYADWAGISSFGNRFFISLTPLFVLGLSVFLERASISRSARRGCHCFRGPGLVHFLNMDFMFQMGRAPDSGSRTNFLEHSDSQSIHRRASAVERRPAKLSV